MSVILRIDAGEPDGVRLRTEPLGVYAGLGGRALASRIVSAEVAPHSHPLGSANRLVLAPGLLSGTGALSGRLSIGCKSPLTDSLSVTSVGGPAARSLARLGYGAVIMEGRPAREGFHIVVMDKSGARVESAGDLRGLSVVEVGRRLRERHGAAASVIAVGGAGERRMAASVVSALDESRRPARHIGRGGAGAVMGAKGIKALVVDPAGCPDLAAVWPQSMADADAALRGMLRRSRLDQASRTLPHRGGEPDADGLLTSAVDPTAAGDGTPSAAGPTFGCRNCTAAGCPDIFSGDAGSSGRPDFDAVWVFSEVCGIVDAEAVVALVALAGEYGLDVTELGIALRVAMEAGIVPFGDVRGALELVRDVGAGRGVGHILGAGAAVSATCLGIETVFVEGSAKSGCGCLWSAKQLELSRTLRIAAAALETLGYCRFVSFTVLERPEVLQAMVDVVNAVFGLVMSAEEVVSLAQDVLRIEGDFNRRSRLGAGWERPAPFSPYWPQSPYGALFEASRPDREHMYEA